MAHHDPIGLIAPNAGLAQLNERSRDIFRQIVESYLATGEPVGSRNISRLIAVPLSPASVRNVMSDLEALGLIYAPHTSAGRLPTEASWVWIDCRSGSVRSPTCIKASTKNLKPSSVGNRPAEVCGA